MCSSDLSIQYHLHYEPPVEVACGVPLVVSELFVMLRCNLYRSIRLIKIVEVSGGMEPRYVRSNLSTGPKRRFGTKRAVGGDTIKI